VLTFPGNLTPTSSSRDGSGLDICRAAKAKRLPPSVLVVTPRPEDAPDALLAGCDGILLKPFTANLVVNRTSRLLRARFDQLRVRSARVRNKGAHLRERSELLKLGVTREWPATSCPYCAHHSVTSFDYTSLRRAWYACVQCKKVWLAKRLDS
jgi:DNA-binding response OmpR family regulator